MSAIRSGAYSLGNKLIHIVISIGSLAILGRLLTPEDFGIFGIILAVQALFVPMLDMGLVPAFIKLEDVDAASSNAFYTVNIVLGIFNAVCLIIISPLLGTIYDKPLIMPLMVIFAVSIIVGSLSRQGGIELQREKRFDKILKIDLASMIAGTVAAILGALSGLGVWALNLKVITDVAVRYVTTRMIWQGRYCLTSWGKIRQFKHSFIFGGEIVISRLMNGALLSLDKLFFGKIYSVTTLGQYTKAIEVVSMPDNNIRQAITAPAFAHLARKDPKDKSNNYALLSQVVLLVAGFPCIVLIVTGDWLLPLIMGQQWLVAGEYVQILGLWGMGKIIYGIAAIIYLNEMRSREWMLINGFAIFFVLGPAMFAALALDSGPMNFVIILSVTYFLFSAAVLMHSFRRYSRSRHSIRKLFIAFCNIFLVISLGFGIRQFMESQIVRTGFISDIIVMSCAIIIMGLTYMLLMLWLNKDQLSDYADMLRIPKFLQ